MQLGYTPIDKSAMGKPGGPSGYADAPDKKISEGMLKRPEGHEIYYHEYGNPEGSPVMFLHGGPGAGTSPDVTKLFDPEHYRIILFDQRGCGKSKPNAHEDLAGALTHNTTQDLIGDIEALREQLKLGAMHVFGGSWGSTLALAYAQAHPERVKSLVLRGIFTCTKRDIDYFYQGNAAQYDVSRPAAHAQKEGAYRAYLGKGEEPGMIPPAARDERMAEAYAEAWKDYVETIPPQKRGDMVAAYHAIINGDAGKEDKLKAARAWARWEGVTSYLCHDVTGKMMEAFFVPAFAIPFAAIENHYFMHGAFLNGSKRDQRELTKPENVKKIAHLPIYIVHGAYDQVCPVYQAQELVASLRKAGAGQTEYKEVPCGHSWTERPIAAQLVAFTDLVRDREKAKTGSMAEKFAKKPFADPKYI